MLYSSIYHVSCKVFILCIFVYMVCEEGIGLCLVCGMFVLFVCVLYTCMDGCMWCVYACLYVICVTYVYCVFMGMFPVVLDVDKQTTPNYILRS